MVQKNGLEDYYVIRNQKKLRFGYTTGSCAAGAARGAARLLFGEDEISEVELMTPKGILLHLETPGQETEVRTRQAARSVRMQETIRIPQMESWFMRKLRNF